MADQSELLDDVRGGTARRSLRFIVLVDVSGSMAGDKIQAVNRAIRECIPEMRRNNLDNPFAEMFVEVITFSTGAQWHVPRISVQEFSWRDLGADGVTDFGAALDLVTQALDVQNMGKRNLPPVLLLLSDGAPTDDWEHALRRFERRLGASRDARSGSPSRSERAPTRVCSLGSPGRSRPFSPPTVQRRSCS